MYTPALLLFLVFWCLYIVYRSTPATIYFAPARTSEPMSAISELLESITAYSNIIYMIYSTYSALCALGLHILSSSFSRIIQLAPYLAEVIPVLAYIALAVFFAYWSTPPDSEPPSDLSTSPASSGDEHFCPGISSGCSHTLSWLTGGLLALKTHHDQAAANHAAEVDVLRSQIQRSRQELS